MKGCSFFEHPFIGLAVSLSRLLLYHSNPQRLAALCPVSVLFVAVSQQLTALQPLLYIPHTRLILLVGGEVHIFP